MKCIWGPLYMVGVDKTRSSGSIESLNVFERNQVPPHTDNTRTLYYSVQYIEDGRDSFDINSRIKAHRAIWSVCLLSACVQVVVAVCCKTPYKNRMNNSVINGGEIQQPCYSKKASKGSVEEKSKRKEITTGGHIYPESKGFFFLSIGRICFCFK